MDKRYFAAGVVILFLCTLVFGVGEKAIYVILGSENSGLEISAVVRQPSTDYLYDDVNGFEDTKPDSNSGIDLTESSNMKGCYYGDFPSGITAGNYDIIIIDSNATLLDYNDIQLITYSFPWDGSVEITNYILDVEIDAVFADTSAGGEGPWGPVEITKEDINNCVASELATYDPPTKTEMDSGFDAVPTANENRDAVFGYTGVTAGGTWTFANLTKYQAAWLIGKWTDDEGDGTYEISDAEDPNTDVLQYESSGSSPFKTVTVP